MKKLNILLTLSLISLLCACVSPQQQRLNKIEKTKARLQQLENKSADLTARYKVMNAIFTSRDDASEAQNIMANPSQYYLGEKTAARIKFYFEHPYQVPNPVESPSAARHLAKEAHKYTHKALQIQHELTELQK